jgi:hypothetical protein
MARQVVQRCRTAPHINRVNVQDLAITGGTYLDLCYLSW